MKTIAIVSQKGGAGKTTLALHLAVAAQLAGLETVVLDMDPQGTSEAWAAWREEAPPAVVAAKASTLPRTLEKAAAAGAGMVVIDTPPLAESEAREAAKAADLVLIPCRPRAFDLHAIRMSGELMRSAGKPAFVVFNACPPRATTIYAEAGELVQRMKLAVCPVHLTERAAFHQATGGGKSAQETEPDGKAAAEIAKLWNWVCQQVDVSTRRRSDTKTRGRRNG